MIIPVTDSNSQIHCKYLLKKEKRKRRKKKNEIGNKSNCFPTPPHLNYAYCSMYALYIECTEKV